MSRDDSRVDGSKDDEKTTDEKELSKQKVPLSKLFRYTTTWERFLLFLGAFVSIASGAGLPLMSILQGRVSQAFINEQKFRTGVPVYPGSNDTYDQNEFTDAVYAVVYNYIYLSVGVFLAANIQVTCFLIVCENMTNRLRRLFVRAILRQEIAWFDKNNSGKLAIQLFDNLERVKEGTGDKMGLMIQYIAQFITGLIIAFCHDWKLTLIMLAITPLQAFFGFMISKTMGQYTVIESIRYSKAGAVAEEVLSSIRTVVAFNGVEREIRRFTEALQSAREMGMRRNMLVGLSFGGIGLVNYSGFAIAFYIGISWVHDGAMQPGDLLTVFFAVMMGSVALGQAGPQAAVLGTAQGAAVSIFEVLDREPEIDSSSLEGIRDVAVKGGIELRDVAFRYPSRPEVKVLNGLTLRVQPGEKVALVGASGCGKSTVVGLLLRYYDAESGQIFIDGRPLSSLNVEFLRQQIAVVSQEPILFNCSIEENIKYGNEALSQAEMEAACKLANAHNFIAQLPKGYHTLVGDRGTQLSGGQKQRIAIARALVRDPRILLLDEATSALDAESEGVVQHALDKASHGRTTIVIAHRLSTVRNADKIIAIKEGRVVECGTHAELIEEGGLYYDLVNAQTFSDAIDNVAVTEDDDEKPPLQKQTSEVNGTDTELRHRGATIGSLVPVDDDTSKAKAGDLKRLRKELEEEGVRETNLIEILYQAREEWLWLGLGLFSAVFGGFIFPAYAVFFTEILDIFAKPAHTMLTEGHFWALMFLVLAFAQAAAFFGNVYFCGIAAERLTSGLRSRVFKNVVSHEIGYFDSPLHSSGRICTRLATDVPTLKSAIDFRLATVITTAVSIVCGVGLAFYYGWKMALVVLALFPLIAIGQTLRQRLVNGAHSRKASKAIEKSGKVAMEAIEHVRTVQSLTRENTFHHKFCSFLDAPHKEGQRQAIIQGFSYGFASCSMFVLNCCSYRFAMYLIVNDIMLPMVALRVLYCVSITATTLGFASAYFPEYMKARFAGGIIFNMLHDQPVIDSLDKSGEQKKLTGKIEFRNVRFCYPERKEIEILKGLSFDVNVGQSLALVGASGCGKSTVIGLLERFYDVANGEVLLDGVDIRRLNPAATRAQIALVSQEPTLFDATVAENIAYGLDGVSQEDIEAAAIKANIHKFIAQLPQGYDTNVGNKGTQLSGGQKQRIAIARALVRNPRVLLLDEATSALDTESEKVVQEALDRAREGRTCILIAHRLSTVIGADKIAVVQAGRIVEQGTHSELLALRGAYFELTQKQNSKH